jgi:CDP-glycerol glycerophosphotransferase (TagB/SpsB family)
MRFLFATLQTYESEFYGVVQRELETRGHTTKQVTVSREAAKLLRAQGLDAVCLHDVEAALPPADNAAEAARIEGTYPIPHLRDAYRGDLAIEGWSEEASQRRAVATFRALEQVFDEFRPDVACPEVGNESIRVTMHLVALAREVPALFLLLSIFPKPLRIYVDTLHARAVPLEEVRELTAEESAEVDAFRTAFTEQATPIREYRRVPAEWRRVRVFADHVRRKRQTDSDNEYLQPWRLLRTNFAEKTRALAARPFYDELATDRPFVYFPLHVTDDYKIKRIIPHAVDQASLIEQVADALPAGYDVVIKEHPMSLGRNSVALLRRLRRRSNIRLVAPRTSTHELIKQSEAVAVISSTVGLEALLYDKPVLTMGDPYYAGYGVTLDLTSFADIRERVPELLRFRPDPERIRRVLHAVMRSCYPGKPVLVDRSEENARTIADTLEQAATKATDLRGKGERTAVLAP